MRTKKILKRLEKLESKMGYLEKLIKIPDETIEENFNKLMVKIKETGFEHPEYLRIIK